MKGIVLASILAVTGAVWAEEVPLTPNPDYTTGDYCTKQDPDFDGYRYEEKIPYCRRGVSQHRKRQVYEAYAIPDRCKRNYTVDHFIPLSMGGSNKFENLWPEHKAIKHTRETLEQEIYDQLRRGEISQKEAVEIIIDSKMNPPMIAGVEDGTAPAGCASP